MNFGVCYAVKSGSLIKKIVLNWVSIDIKLVVLTIL